MAQMVKNTPAMQESRVRSLGPKDPWRRERLPIPVFLPGSFHGQRSLASYSPRGHKEPDRTEQLSIHTCSTLCDPMDCGMSGSSALYYLLQFAQTHIH